MSEYGQEKKYDEYDILWEHSSILCKMHETKNGGLLGSFGIGAKLFISMKPAKDGNFYAKIIPTKKRDPNAPAQNQSEPTNYSNTGYQPTSSVQFSNAPDTMSSGVKYTRDAMAHGRDDEFNKQMPAPF